MKIGDLFQHTFTAIRETISPDVRKSVELSIPSMTMVEVCRADDFDFFAPFIAAGDLTVGQMQHACQRYYLGKTKSGQPVFWMIDDMLTPLDAHIGSSTWMSTLLKAREPLIASWRVTHCLFGLHLLGVAGGGVCVVESEASAVILSELLPEYVWMATGYLANLNEMVFLPLKGCHVVCFPATDPTGDTYLLWLNVASEARQYGIDVTVSRFLEDHATDKQKERKIDLIDLIFDDIE